MAEIWMDVDVAVASAPVNVLPLVDDTDFKTIEDAVVFNQAGLALFWNFTTTAGVTTVTAVTPTSAGDYDWTDFTTSGMYGIEIPASGGASANNDTEGTGHFTGVATGILPWTGPKITFRAAGLNNLLVDNAFSATRGLAGTALPDAAADAATGLPISDAGGLDLDTKLANTNEITVARMGALTDWINGGRLDLIIDAILADTAELQTTLSAKILARTNNANLHDLIQSSLYILESQRNHHTHITPGETFYVDPVNGATHASGARGGISDPYLTVQDCHDNAVTDSNHDVIMLIPGAAAGVTTHTVAATTTISKRYTLIRGPGRDFIFTRTGSGDTLALTGEGVEVDGLQIGTAATGSGHGVAIAADFAWVHNNWINDTQGDGVNINQSENCIIEKNRFQDTGAGGSGQGVHVLGTGSSSSNNVIRKNIFEDVQGDAIRLVGGTILDTVIDENIIHGSSGWGINISADSTDAVVSNNIIGNNTSGDIQDNGTTTLDQNNDQWAKHTIATEARLAELDAGNLPTDVANVQASVDALNDFDNTADEVLANMIKIVGSSTAAAAQAAAAAGIIDTFTAVTGTLTTAAMTTDLTGFDDDRFIGRHVVFTGAPLAGEETDITDYASASGLVTFNAGGITEAPINGTTFVII